MPPLHLVASRPFRPDAELEAPLSRILLVAAAALITWLLWRAWLGANERHPAVRNVLLVLMLLSLVLLAGALLGRLHWLAALPAAVLPMLRRLWLVVGALGRYGGLWTRLLGGLGLGGAGRTESGRSGTERDADRGARPPGRTLDRDEALRILGLQGRPNRAEINAAYRRLMQRVHPDHGGSEHLAQQLNLARDLLLTDAGESRHDSDENT